MQQLYFAVCLLLKFLFLKERQHSQKTWLGGWELTFLSLQRTVSSSSLRSWLTKISGRGAPFPCLIRGSRFWHSCTAAQWSWRDFSIYAMQVLLADFTSLNVTQEPPKWQRWVSEYLSECYPQAWRLGSHMSTSCCEPKIENKLEVCI